MRDCGHTEQAKIPEHTSLTDLSTMDPEIVLGTIQSVLAMISVGIAAFQLYKQLRPSQNQVGTSNRSICTYI